MLVPDKNIVVFSMDVNQIKLSLMPNIQVCLYQDYFSHCAWSLKLYLFLPWQCFCSQGPKKGQIVTFRTTKQRHWRLLSLWSEQPFTQFITEAIIFSHWSVCLSVCVSVRSWSKFGTAIGGNFIFFKWTCKMVKINCKEMLRT